MGRFRVTGDSAQAFIQSVLSNDVSSLIHGQAQYNLMCNEAGGIIDDLVAYRSEEGFLLVVNASNREKDLEWLRAHAPADVSVEDRTFERALVAFQGAEAERLLPAQGLEDIRDVGLRRGEVGGISSVVAGTGDGGEDGFGRM